MSSDESTDGEFDHTDLPASLPATVPYDIHSIPTSPTQDQPTPTPTNVDAAPLHDETASQSQDHSGSYHSSIGTLGRIDSSLDSQDRSDVVEHANRRLFRSQSDYLDHAGVGGKRKHGYQYSEEAVERRNLARGHSDLTNITSNPSIISGYSDVQPFRGKIDKRERLYLQNDINVEGLTTSMDSSNISASADTVLHPGRLTGTLSSPSVNHSLGSQRDHSFGSTNSMLSNPTFPYSGTESDHHYSSQHESLEIPTATTAVVVTTSSTTTADTTTAATAERSPPSPLPAAPPSSTSKLDMYHVESSCPVEDLSYSGVMESASSQHLQDYSPVRPEDFAKELAGVNSSTPLRLQVASTFPDEDFTANPQQSIHQGNLNLYGDATPPYNSQQYGAPSIQDIDQIQSPFLDQQTISNQASSSTSQPTMTTTVSDHAPPPAVSTIRKLRSTSNLGSILAARTTTRYYIMFASSIDSQKYHRSLLAMGAMIVTHWDQCTHLVTDDIRRKTVNLLCALASKKYVVSERWIQDSIANARFEIENDYVLIRQTSANYFMNKKLFFYPSARIKRSDAVELAKAAGAKLLAKEPEVGKTDNNLVIISSGVPEEIRRYEDAGYETMGRDNFLEQYGRVDH